MAKGLLSVAVLGFMLLALAGCAGRDEEAPRSIIRDDQVITPADPRFDVLLNDPRAKPFMSRLCGACRQGHSVHLRMPGGPDFVDDSSMRTPYTELGRISLFAGETLSVGAEEGTKGPISLHYVETVQNSDQILTVRLEQRADVADGYGMRLTVSSPFGKALKYAVLEVHPGGETEIDSGPCPAPPHGENRKNFLYPLAQIVIFNLSFVSTEEAEACAP